MLLCASQIYDCRSSAAAPMFYLGPLLHADVTCTPTDNVSPSGDVTILYARPTDRHILPEWGQWREGFLCEVRVPDGAYLSQWPATGRNRSTSRQDILLGGLRSEYPRPAPNTPASATRGSAPCRTSASDQLVWLDGGGQRTLVVIGGSFLVQGELEGFRGPHRGSRLERPFSVI
jgi:hypothetical protein